MAKRGRPRVYTENPTPEVAARRRALARDGDQMLTSNPLDLLKSRGLVSPTQADAGRVFGWMRRQIYGAVEVGALDMDRIRGAAVEGAERAGLEARYGAAREALQARGRRVVDVTENVAIYQRWPGVLAKSRIAERDRRELALLREGLEILDLALFHSGREAA